jgi:hypothetical protein
MESWKWDLGVMGIGTGIWDPKEQNCNNGTKVIAETGPGNGNGNGTGTGNGTRVVGPEIGIRTRDWGHGTGVDCPKSGPGPGGPRSGPDRTPNVRVQVHPMPGPDPNRRSGSSW